MAELEESGKAAGGEPIIFVTVLPPLDMPPRKNLALRDKFPHIKSSARAGDRIKAGKKRRHPRARLGAVTFKVHTSS